MIRNLNLFIALLLLATSCNTRIEKKQKSSVPLVGTWKLVRAKLVEKGDTTITDHTSRTSFVKIINDSHFAFLHHDLNNGKDSAAVFTAGGGSYILRDSTYTEHLEYCSAREWENNDFTFTVSIRNDTLIQKGIEKIESKGIERLNIETYVRMK